MMEKGVRLGGGAAGFAARAGEGGRAHQPACTRLPGIARASEPRAERYRPLLPSTKIKNTLRTACKTKRKALI